MGTALDEICFERAAVPHLLNPLAPQILKRLYPGEHGAALDVGDQNPVIDLVDLQRRLVFETARYWRRQGEHAKAAAALDTPPLKARKPDKLWGEIENASRDALDEGSVSVAYRLAASHGSESGTAFADGEWLSGWIALRFLQEPAFGRTWLRFGGILAFDGRSLVTALLGALLFLLLGRVARRPR